MQSYTDGTTYYLTLMNNGKEMQTRILLIDDHAILRKGLRLLLEKQDDFTVVGEAEEGEAGIALIHEFSPDIVVMDITMPGLNGIEATKRITAEYPDTRIIALSIHSERKFVEDMLQAGAAGYILKESVPEDLVRGIRAVMRGAGYLSPSITGIVVSRYREVVYTTNNLFTRQITKSSRRNYMCLNCQKIMSIAKD